MTERFFDRKVRRPQLGTLSPIRLTNTQAKAIVAISHGQTTKGSTSAGTSEARALEAKQSSDKAAVKAKGSAPPPVAYQQAVGTRKPPKIISANLDETRPDFAERALQNLKPFAEVLWENSWVGPDGKPETVTLENVSGIRRAKDLKNIQVVLVENGWPALLAEYVVKAKKWAPMPTAAEFQAAVDAYRSMKSRVGNANRASSRISDTVKSEMSALQAEIHARFPQKRADSVDLQFQRASSDRTWYAIGQYKVPLTRESFWGTIFPVDVYEYCRLVLRLRLLELSVGACNLGYVDVNTVLDIGVNVKRFDEWCELDVEKNPRVVQSWVHSVYRAVYGMLAAGGWSPYTTGNIFSGNSAIPFVEGAGKTGTTSNFIHGAKYEDITRSFSAPKRTSPIQEWLLSQPGIDALDKPLHEQGFPGQTPDRILGTPVGRDFVTTFMFGADQPDINTLPSFGGARPSYANPGFTESLMKRVIDVNQIIEDCPTSVLGDELSRWGSAAEAGLSSKMQDVVPTTATVRSIYASWDIRYDIFAPVLTFDHLNNVNKYGERINQPPPNEPHPHRTATDEDLRRRKATVLSAIESCRVWGSFLAGMPISGVMAESYYAWYWTTGGPTTTRLTTDAYATFASEVRSANRKQIVGAVVGIFSALASTITGNFKAVAGYVGGIINMNKMDRYVTADSVKELAPVYFGTPFSRTFADSTVNFASGPGSTMEQLSAGFTQFLGTASPLSGFILPFEAWGERGFEAGLNLQPYPTDAPADAPADAPLYIPNPTPTSTPWGLYALGAGAAAGLALLLRRKLRK